MEDAFRCELISWREVHRLTRRLALDIHDAGFRPDWIVAIGRGGYVPGRILADFLHRKHLTSFRVAHYEAGARKSDRARVVNPLREDLAGGAVLIADDVNDTGESLAAAVAHVREHDAGPIRTAVLHQKPGSGFEVDYFAAALDSWRWIIYPWAVIEDTTEFLRRMEPPPATAAEARERLEAAYRMWVPLQVVRDALRLGGADRGPSPPPP